MKLRYFKFIMVLAGVVAMSSCKKFLDINKDPDRLPDSNSPLAQLLTGAQVNLGFEGGSDLFRFTTEIMQQMSGLASQPNQTFEYYRYNITGSDQNNVWSSMNASTLSDLQLIINQGSASPYYTGIAKILKAYEVSKMVDVWGDVPFSQAQQLTANTQPAYDNDATIYPQLINLLTDAINNLNAASSVLTPGTNSVMYTNGGNWTLARAQWIKLANTLKLRLILHTRKVDATWATQMNTLINTAGITFMTSNADSWQMNFYDIANQRNPISAFEVSRPNYLFVDTRMLDLMNPKNDPRRPFYFTDFPLGSGIYVGVSAANPPVNANNNNSRIHTFLRGAVTTPSSNGINSAVYSGAAPQRMLPYAEYCFIRAEAALMGGVTSAPLANANAWYREGINASMLEVGVSPANIATYLALPSSTLNGSTANQLQQIIEEKYIALFGVTVEPWNDWRRTGYPSLSIPTNAINTVTAVPRVLFYPQSEIDLNPNCPGQKSLSLQDRVFWDN
jgi:Starch-binding associating with outer membrane